MEKDPLEKGKCKLKNPNNMEPEDLLATYEGTILDNNSLVGRNCLTFIAKVDERTVRFKFYNKFVQSIESPSVRGHIGNHISDWCNNPEPILKEAISKSLDTGLLRLEFTVYLHGNGEPITKKYTNICMEYLKCLIPKKLIYYNPIRNQWLLFMEQIVNNLLLVDLDNKTLMVNYNINKETTKQNSFFYDKVDENILSNIAKLYTFNVPLIVVLIQRKENKISIQQDTYIKLFEKRCKDQAFRTRGKDKDDLGMFVEELTDSEFKQPIAYLTIGGERFKSIRNNTEERGMDPQDMGLVDNNTCKLRYLNTKQDIAKKHTKNIKIDFVIYTNKL
jgi:hypothetical protein